MIRRFKVLGIASLLVGALCGTATNGAQAAKLTATEYPLTLTATQTANVQFIFAGGIRFVECTEAVLSGTINSENEEITMTPTYGGCYSNGSKNVPVTITTNGCTYQFSFFAKNGLTVELRCPPEKKMQIHFYENAAKHLLSQEWFTGVPGKKDESFCTYDIGPQLFGGSMTLAQDNVGTATEDITGAIGLNNIAVESTIANTLLCGKAGAGLASVSGTTTFTGASGAKHLATMVQ